MIRAGIFLIFLAFAGMTVPVHGQRTYAARSVLANGSWFKLAVDSAGLYKIDGSWFRFDGAPALPIPSASIRLFTKGGEPLGESCSDPYIDDLREVALEVYDGGDGQFNANDYLLFHAPGPHRWIPDVPNQQYRFQKNPYSEKAFYYLTLGGTGKRVVAQPASPVNGPVVDRFLGRQCYELDSVNLLSSGKEWFGDELAQAPGKSLIKNLSFQFPHAIAGSTAIVRSRVLARSSGAGARFDLSLNGQVLGQQPVPPVGVNLYDPFAIARSDAFTTAVSNGNLSFTYQFQPGSFGAQGWIDRLEAFVPRALSMNGLKTLSFDDLLVIGQPAVQYRIEAAPADLSVWELTDPFEPRRLNGTRTGSQYAFQSAATDLRSFMAFTGSDHPMPQFVGPVSNQDLHGLGATDMLILAPNAWRAAADSLATLHRNRRSLRVQVVSMEQVQEEFSGGTSDPTGIRDLVKMFYDRARNTPANRPKYLLLMGASSYDPKARIRNNDRPVPTYQSLESLDPLATYCTDDYFGFLDDAENINNPAISNLLDIGIGRIPARSLQEAWAFVDKLRGYDDTVAQGSWRTRLLFMADDEDGNLHLNDAESIAAVAKQVAPAFDQQKIYLDAFRQEAGAGGARYPEANQALDRQLFQGNLIVNYSGHGGKDQLAEEALVTRPVVESWNNPHRLPLFVVATCDFAPYDNPAVRGLGERILLRPNAGGIALMTTTRPVFAFSNRILNENYIRTALTPDANGNYFSLGDAVRAAKNLTYQTSSDLINNRKFMLLGDPALTLAFPTQRVQLTRINGQTPSLADTIRAGQLITVEGEITDRSGNRLNDFQGMAYPAVFDKIRVLPTLANDPGSFSVPINMPGATLFSGVSSVTNGRFQFQFKAPLDMDPVFGKGRIGLYARSPNKDAQGYFEDVKLGGRVTGNGLDTEGPDIRLSLNEPGFAEGGLTNSAPILLADLTDSSGINTAGGIGHDLVATLSTPSTGSTLNPQPSTFLLNDFYQSAPDTYKKGLVRFPLPELEPGSYTLKMRAWDVLNNPSERTLSFVVGEPGSLRIQRVLNYPNPFTDRTSFWFEHNAPGQLLQVSVEVMTISGRIVRAMQAAYLPEGNFCRELEWDGRDDQGQRLGRGTYLYRLRVRANGKGEAHQLGKLVIL